MTAGGMRSDLKRLSEFMFSAGNDEADFTSTNSTKNFMRGPKSPSAALPLVMVISEGYRRFMRSPSPVLNPPVYVRDSSKPARVELALRDLRVEFQNWRLAAALEWLGSGPIHRLKRCGEV
jgi:hypothetical protein